MITSQSSSRLIVADQRRHMLRSDRLALLNREALKGCSPEIAPVPISLEPPFEALDGAIVRPSTPKIDTPLHRWRVWLSPQELFKWERNEMLLKALSGATGRVAWEVVGNSEGIEMYFLCSEWDAALLKTVLLSQFPQSQLHRAEFPSYGSGALQSFRDYYPEPPYHRHLSSYEELSESPLSLLLAAMSELPTGSCGVYQCLFEPAIQPWNRNIACLTDWEFLLRLAGEDATMSRYPQQAPSSELRQATFTLLEKAHPDKPLFFTAVRTGIFSEKPVSSAEILAFNALLGAFQFGGRPLHFLDQDDYLSAGVMCEQQAWLLQRAHSLRNGFLVNSQELTGLAHLPPATEVAKHTLSLELLEPLAQSTVDQTEGTRIGSASIAGIPTPVVISAHARQRATQIIGGSGSGKTTVMQGMLLQDVMRGHGAIYLDPHGDAVHEIIANLGPEERKRCIYIDPGDTNWTLRWNPLERSRGMDRYRHADDLLSAFERTSRDWGDRIAYVLRNGLIGLSYITGATMHDLYNLTRRGSAESKRIIERIVDECGDEAVCRFWRHDFSKSYREADLASPRHKLHKLISGGPSSRMLAQTTSGLNLRHSMDSGEILLVNLSTLGTETRGMLGSFLLTMLLMAALSRSDIAPKERRPFSIFADEAYQFISADAVENLVTQARKFRVNLVLANQYLRQLSREQIDALSTSGTTIIGKLNKSDSQYFTRDLQEKVKAMDIVGLRPFEMFANIDSEVVRFRTEPLPKQSDEAAFSEVLERSRQKYYMDAAQAKSEQSAVSSHRPTLHWRNYFTEEDLRYDSFDG